jgi:hypothetical protein
MAIADNVLVGIKSEADLQELEILQGENELPLLYVPGAKEKVILRKCLKAGGVTDEPMPKSAFLNIHRNGLTNTGYPCGPSVHGIRRGLGKKVDGKTTSPEAPSLVIRPPFAVSRWTCSVYYLADLAPRKVY